MQPESCPVFDGFELDATSGPARLDALQRGRFCQTGLSRLYVARNADGEPIYAQWLVHAWELPVLQAVTRRIYQPLGPGEVLVEGAYTFTAFRGLGAMADGQRQLLEVARLEGASSAVTYVAPENVPSLRGCARVGFELDHVKVIRRRLGVERIKVSSPDGNARTLWLAAVGRERHAV